MRLGIDFGTCFTSAAYLDGGRPVAVRFENASPCIPSAVYVSDDEGVFIGNEAVARRLDNPVRFRSEFKKLLGKDAQCEFGDGRVVNVQDLLTAFLRYVCDSAEAQAPDLGPVHTAVLTIPVHYEQSRRELMIAAAHDAGIAHVDLLPEPVSAAYHWAAAADRGVDDVYILSYDFGGGTFDAALLRYRSRVAVPVGFATGSQTIGGNWIDDAIYELLRAERGEALKAADILCVDDKLKQRRRLNMREKCRSAKERLSAVLHVEIPFESDGIEPFKLTRAHLEAIVRPMVTRTISMCDQMLAGENVHWGAVNRVLLAGGGSRIPLVKTMLEGHSGRPVEHVGELALAVAYGAAYQVETSARAQEIKTARIYNPKASAFDAPTAAKGNAR